ncbi:hypothetical protein ACGF0D_43010 [Kitasatospora sp. NPDC048298]|uniref:hypothetical protein n=1 Tax=Kitasatospora sp. NPDC048298 TaxID=3364049 RepID=UPI00372083E3
MTTTPRIESWEQGGPRVPAWTGDRHNDVNPVCGHHLRGQCAGCGSCTSCDGCYCGGNDGWTADDDRQQQTHQTWHDAHSEGCPDCEHEREQSAGYTRCAKCQLAFPEGRFSMLRHGWACSPLPVIAADEFNWPELYGKKVRFKGREYGPQGPTGGYYWVTGTVVGPYPDNGRGDDSLWPVLELERSDAGYQGRTPIAPREWLAIEVVEEEGR